MEVITRDKEGPSNFISEYLSEETQNTKLKRRMQPYINCSIIYNTMTWKKRKYPSINEWIKKKWYICTMEYEMVIKNNEILPSATAQMDLDGIMLSEISQNEKEKYQMISLTCGINKTK